MGVSKVGCIWGRPQNRCELQGLGLLAKGGGCLYVVLCIRRLCMRVAWGVGVVQPLGSYFD